ncbi:Uncharacterised protein [BD1-7 clade bacterium]|uniref:ApbE family protein n=1 Tax=BD1-7 clade bacterium TaxID=2029982 RepID=A0A5S9P2A3_9GAMM|nr:Uncharacterised protein [BD1-7 clade bacterium]CAA0122713.1 Uncharacterised protein [BD1-7 clade bacterium]
MEMVIVTFCVFVLFFIAMSLGYIFQNKPLRGSCGGVAKLMGNENCEICGGDPNKCETEQEKAAATDLAYDATARKK